MKPRLAFCPIGKFVFSHEDALRHKELLQQKLTALDVDFVSLDGVIPDGMVRDQEHVEPVVDHFRKQDVDAVFVPHCNFGTEGAVGMIGKKLDVPLLLWGPRDEAPEADGTRLRDSLCGLFASSKVLHKLGVPFTYVENCRLEDPALEKGIVDFLRAANVAKAFRRGIRIGHIGQRIDFFWTTIINESELLERFNVEILPIDMVDFIARVKTRADTSDYAGEVASLKESADLAGFESDEPIANILAMRDEMLEAAETNRLDALAVQTFTSLPDALGAYTSYADGAVAETYPHACESDIHGAVSAVLLQRASLAVSPTYLVDLTIRHPTNDNAVLLWHCGAPPSMKHPDARMEIGQHWILPSPVPGMTHFRMKDGPITVARFDGDRGDYRLAVGECLSTEGPDTRNTYVWAEVDNWPKWERAVIEGPFIHHAGMIYGHYGAALEEACKYVPGLTPVVL